MPFIFASIMPHSPVTIPSVGKDKATMVAKTLSGLKELEGELYVMQPDTIFIVSPYAPMADKAFSINLAPQFTADFHEFGDTDIKLKFECDIELISKIKEYADCDEEAEVKVNVINQNVLDYGSAVTLYHLTQHVKNIKIVPVSLSLLDVQEHFNFGRMLHTIATQSNKRIAIIASTELSHSNNSSSEQYHPDAETYDHKVLELIKNRTLDEIVKLNSELVSNAQAENSQKTLAVLFGALKNIDTEGRVISYETSLDEGLFIAQFNLV